MCGYNQYFYIKITHMTKCYVKGDACSDELQVLQNLSTRFDYMTTTLLFWFTLTALISVLFSSSC